MSSSVRLRVLRPLLLSVSVFDWTVWEERREGGRERRKGKRSKEGGEKERRKETERGLNYEWEQQVNAMILYMMQLCCVRLIFSCKCTKLHRVYIMEKNRGKSVYIPTIVFLLAVAGAASVLDSTQQQQTRDDNCQPHHKHHHDKPHPLVHRCPALFASCIFSQGECRINLG